jgi:hypothetical protein
VQQNGVTLIGGIWQVRVAKAGTYDSTLRILPTHIHDGGEGGVTAIPWFYIPFIQTEHVSQLVSGHVLQACVGVRLV